MWSRLSVRISTCSIPAYPILDLRLLRASCLFCLGVCLVVGHLDSRSPVHGVGDPDRLGRICLFFPSSSSSPSPSSAPAPSPSPHPSPICILALTLPMLIPPAHNLPPPPLHAPPHLLQIHIVVHERHVPVRVHRDVRRPVPHAAAPAAAGLVRRRARQRACARVAARAGVFCGVGRADGAEWAGGGCRWLGVGG